MKHLFIAIFPEISIGNNIQIFALSALKIARFFRSYFEGILRIRHFLLQMIVSIAREIPANRAGNNALKFFIPVIHFSIRYNL